MLSLLMKEHLKVDIEKMRKKNFLQVQEEYTSGIYRRVMKKHGWKEVFTCPLCRGTTHTIELIRYGSPLLKCGNCELRFHKNIPADPKDIYQDSEHIVYPMDGSEDHYNYRRDRLGRERVKLLERYCGALSGKRVLDIGCGNGYFLAALKETGARCMGSELSEKLKQFTMDKTGVPVHSEPLDRFPEKDFDVITLFDVIEHIEEPVPFMATVRDLLKPGGHLLVYTPNCDSFSVKVMGEYSNNVDPSEHVILFSRKSLEFLGNITGLSTMHTETRGLDIHSILAYQDHRGEARDPFLTQWVEELQAMIDASGSGDYIRVVYQKK